MKKLLYILLTCLVGLMVLTGCSHEDEMIVGDDWRITGIVKDAATITIDNQEIDILLCVHSEDANIYYNMKEQTLFAKLKYPITVNAEAYQSIDFSYLNDDDNSDVTIKFTDNEKDIVMVWLWDSSANEYVFSEELSVIPVS